jgi:transposase
MRPPGTPKQLEKRRRRAVQLLESGQDLSSVARQVGAASSSVFRWRQAYRRNGPRGLVPKPTPGRSPRLAPAEERRLVKLLTRGALRAGYRTDLWTLPRVTELIHQEFGVRYHFRARVESADCIGLELPEARAPGDRAR